MDNNILNPMQKTVVEIIILKKTYYECTYH